MADNGGLSAGDTAGIAGAVVAVFTALGGGIVWLAGWHGRRQETRAQRNGRWEADLDARERAIEEKLSASLSHCEGRCAAVEEKFDKVRIALLLILPELQRAAPYSPALKQVRELLRDVFPIPFDLPAEMAAQLEAIDVKTSGDPASPAT